MKVKIKDIIVLAILLLVTIALYSSGCKKSMLDELLTVQEAYQKVVKKYVPRKAEWYGCSSYEIMFDTIDELEKSTPSPYKFAIEHNTGSSKSYGSNPKVIINDYESVQVEASTGKIFRVNSLRRTMENEDEYIATIEPRDIHELILRVDKEFNIDLINYFKMNYDNIDIFTHYKEESSSASI